MNLGTWHRVVWCITVAVISVTSLFRIKLTAFLSSVLMFHPEDEGSSLLRNMGRYLPHSNASHPSTQQQPFSLHPCYTSKWLLGAWCTAVSSVLQGPKDMSTTFPERIKRHFRWNSKRDTISICTISLFYITGCSKTNTRFCHSIIPELLPVAMS